MPTNFEKLLYKNLKPIIKDLEIELRSVHEDDTLSIMAIDYLEVRKEKRRKGIGSQALQGIIDSSFSSGIDALVITANLKYGTPFDTLVQFYQKFGFKQIPFGIEGAMYLISETTSKSKAMIKYSLALSSERQRLEQEEYADENGGN